MKKNFFPRLFFTTHGPYVNLLIAIILSSSPNWCEGKAAVASENGKSTPPPPSVLPPLESVFKIKCPDPTTILPCTCSVRSFQINSESQVECRGDLVTQEVINNVLTSLRRVNSGRRPNKEEEEEEVEWLHVSKFKIQHTKLSQLDLTPFLHTVFKSLSINFNDNLTLVFGPNSKTLHLSGFLFSKKIKTDKLYMSSNNLTDAGFQDVLHYFDPTVLIQVILSRNSITGSSGQVYDSVTEFLPGLSRLTNLRKLDLSRNKIVRVGGGQFRRNQNLQEINLESNEIAELAENAFLLDSPAPKPAKSENSGDKSRLSIGLTANSLEDGRVHPKWIPPQNFAAFPYTSRPVRVDLSQNKFEFISAANFQQFLTTNLENSLSFCDSVHCEPRTFFCSSRMTWLKNGRLDFEHRVSGLNCTNDRRHTVFTSELTAVAPPEYFSLCPPATSTIAPCVCEGGHLKIDCRGGFVSQKIIDRVIPELLKVNSLPLETALNFHTFTIRRTNLRQLDLTTFLGHHFDNLAIIKNANLSKIYVDGSLWSQTKRLRSSRSPPQSKEKGQWGVIDVNYVGLNENALDDEGLGQLFNFFAPATLTALNLQFNKIRGSSGVNQYIFGGLVFTADATIRTRSLEEFLPGFSALSHLEFLVLSNNNISKIGGGQFKSNKNLRVLDLGYNGIEEIGSNGLLIDHDEGILDENLIINLRYNLLKDQNISQSNGLEHLKRPTVVDFSGNRFQFISQQNFYPFLQQNVLNAAYFFFNHFVCDKRLLWLKERREELEARVIQVKCLNDPTQTAFTTSVIF